MFPFVGGKFYVDLMVTTMILAIFALSLELLVGYTGLVSFGHAAFFGIAAYATALLSPQAGAASIAWLLPAVIGIAALAALAIGALSLRTRGIYFIMVTLAFAQMAYFVFHDMTFAGGSDGLYLNIKPVLAVGAYTLLDLDATADVLLLHVRARWCVVYGLLALVAPLALRPCARRHQGQRAADARRRILDVSVQARGVRARRRAWRASPASCTR